MDSRITVFASSSVYYHSGAEQFLNDLSQNYSVQVVEPYSDFDGMGDPYEDIITSFGISIAAKFVDYITEHIIFEGAKIAFKELLFKPFLERLENFKTLNENMPIERLSFQYEDITIWVGYARKNNINVVSIMSAEVLKKLPQLRQTGAGDLNLIASPVIKKEMEWWFVSDRERPITEFSENWGLGFNLNDRLVYHVQNGTQTDDYWWD